jgi:hypothetical protein
LHHLSQSFWGPWAAPRPPAVKGTEQACCRLHQFACYFSIFSCYFKIYWHPWAGVPGENHLPWASKCKHHLRLRVECTLFCNLQSRERIHAVLVIGLYELLSNPTT